MTQFSKRVKGITEKTAEARLKRVTLQNKKLLIDVKEKTGAVVDLESHRREVLAANAVVRQQALAIPFRLAPTLAAISDPKEIHKVLHAALVECFNDLAYERENQ